MRSRLIYRNIFLLQEYPVPLSYDTGALDTLNEISLAEEVKNYERRYDQKTCGILYNVLVKSPSCEGLLEVKEARRNRLINVRHKIELVDLIHPEHRRIELVSPLPREREEEYRYHHGYGKRENDLEEGSEYSGSVNVCRLLKLVGNALEELSHKVYVKTVLKSKTAQRKKY